MTAAEMRALKAKDYAARVARGEDAAALFEYALDEGLLEGIAAAVELAAERKDRAAVAQLRALVQRRAPPRPLPASAPPQPAAPRGHEVFCALPPDHVGGCIDAFGGALPKRAAQAEGETCPECANLGTRTFGGGPCSKGCSARRSGKGEGGR